MAQSVPISRDPTGERSMNDGKIVRLNAELFPVTEAEEELYGKFGLSPVRIEADSPQEILEQAEDCVALFVVSSELPAEVIRRLRNCLVISRIGAGTDKIDVATATEEGILVTNVPYFCVEEQADHTMALLLALTRQLFPSASDLRQGAWRRARENPGFQRLAGKTLGLIGFGRSAQAVARRASAFGMRVIATRRRLDQPSPAARRLGVEMLELEDVLGQADYVSLHLPLTESTYHLLDYDLLREIKQGAYLINTSRGAIVDELALAEMIEEGWLAGAGIDTFEHLDPHKEAVAPQDHPFLELDNVVLTPHVAAFSPQAMYDVAKGSVENVVAVLNGFMVPDENLVNPTVNPRVPLKDHDRGLFERVANKTPDG